MTRLSFFRRLSLALCILSLFGSAFAADAKIIAHPSVSPEEISGTSLIRIYAMQKRVWANGEPIKVFRLPESNTVHENFVSQYLQMQPYQLHRLWHRLVFSGTGSVPQEVRSEEEMKERVMSTKGAIGYISVNDEENTNSQAGVGHE